MIDTDKYEGHTPAPWTISEEYAYELFVYAGDVRLAKMDGNAPLHTNEHGNPEDVNAQLIADAPKLLAEVKRLRELKIAEEEELERLSNHAQFYEGEYNLTIRAKQELFAEVKRLRKVIYDALYVLQTDGWNKNRTDAINRLEKVLINELLR